MDNNFRNVPLTTNYANELNSLQSCYTEHYKLHYTDRYIQYIRTGDGRQVCSGKWVYQADERESRENQEQKYSPWGLAGAEGERKTGGTRRLGKQKKSSCFSVLASIKTAARPHARVTR